MKRQKIVRYFTMRMPGTDGKETTWKVTDYKPGDWIRGQFCREEQMEKTPDMTDQMQIAAVTTRRPFGVDTSQSYTDSGTIIVSDAWLDAHDPQGGAKITVKYAASIRERSHRQSKNL